MKHPRPSSINQRFLSACLVLLEVGTEVTDYLIDDTLLVGLSNTALMLRVNHLHDAHCWLLISSHVNC